MSTTVRPAFVLAFVVLGASAALSCASVNPGLVFGDIRFRNASSGLVSQCGADPVASLGSFPVYLRDVASSLATRSNYSPSNITSGADFLAATYKSNPNVTASGSSFTTSVEALGFVSGATYRFGATSAAGAGAQFCSGVYPLSLNPDGTRCDQSECAVLLEIKVRLTGSAEDLAALDPSLPATCTAEYLLGGTDGQAASGVKLFPVSDLTAGYRTIPLIVRANVTAVVRASCTATVLGGQDGFVMTPGTRSTRTSEGMTVTPPCALSGTPTPPTDVTLNLPVARTAGSIKGLFDLVGFVEDRATVRVGEVGSPFRTQATVDPANPTGALIWRLDAVPSGTTPVAAGAVADSFDKFVQFPMRDGLNQRVEIAGGALCPACDLGATFVSKPAESKGQVTLFDYGQADLATLVLGPFLADEARSSQQSNSYAEAVGNPALPQSGGASGIGGVSRGRLRGTYDAALKQAVLNYHLLIPGIGLPNSTVDGTGARNTAWDFKKLLLFMKPTANTTEKLTLTPGILHRIESLSTPEIASPQSYCFGRATITVNVDPTLGALFHPSATVNSTAVYEPGINGVTPVASVEAHASRVIPFAERAPSISLAASLVAGLGYRAYPGVYFAPPTATTSSQASHISLPEIPVPETGVLGCAERVELCVTTGGQGSTATTLTIEVLDESGLGSPDLCLPHGPVSLTIKVNSTAATSVRYVMYPVGADVGADCSDATAQVLCNGDCTFNPQFPVSFPSLPAGSYTLRACATDNLRCYAQTDHLFQVQPASPTASPTISCPPPISVTLNTGETSLSRADTRLSGLVATVSGTCGVPAAIADNAPNLFPIGTTSVIFSAPDVGSCATPVTVNLAPTAPPRQFAVRATGAGNALLKVYRAEPLAALSQTVAYPGPLFEYAFSPDGNKVAFAGRGTTAAVDISGGATSLAIVPSQLLPTNLTEGLFIAWHPQGTRYAVLGRQGSGSSVQLVVKVFRADAVGAPFIHPVQIPPGMSADKLQLTAMAYSPDGSRMLIAGSGPLGSGFVTVGLRAPALGTGPNAGRLSGPFASIMTTPVAAANREEVTAVAFSGGVAEIATTARVYRLAGSGFATLLTHATLDSTFARLGSKLVFTEFAPTNPQRFRLATGSVPAGTIDAGSTTYGIGPFKYEVAATPDGNLIGTLDSTGVVIVDSAFVEVSRLQDTTVGGIRFRQ